jgi:hypothetical protein
MTDPRESTQRPEKLPPTGGEDLGPDADELAADNPVEQDTIETLDPENPPA